MEDIFSDLRHRIFTVNRHPFLPLPKVAYKYTIAEITSKYFQNRLNINIEILENLKEEVEQLLKNPRNWIKRIELDEVKEDNPFEQPYYQNFDEKRATFQKQKKLEFIAELNYYKQELDGLIEATNRFDANDITTENDRLKFNLPISEVVGFMRLLKDAEIINVNQNKELSKFIAKNFASSGKSEDFSLDRLEKLMSPNEDVIEKLDTKLVELQRALQQHKARIKKLHK